MTPDKPGDAQQGKPAEDEQVALEAAEAKAEAKKPRRRRKPAKAGEAAAEQPTAKAASKAKGAAAKGKADDGKAKAEPAAKKRVAAKKPAKAKQPAAEEQPPSQREPAETQPPAEPAAKPSAPVPAAGRRTRAQAKRPPRGRAVRARARYVRTSARKARLVCSQITGKSVHEARAILAFTPRGAARDWSKLLESAVANAESNHELLEDDLVVHEAYADEGPTIKRFRPRAMGRATPIHKRTSHLTITLATGAGHHDDKRR